MLACIYKTCCKSKCCCSNVSSLVFAAKRGRICLRAMAPTHKSGFCRAPYKFLTGLRLCQFYSVLIAPLQHRCHMPSTADKLMRAHHCASDSDLKVLLSLAVQSPDTTRGMHCSHGQENSRSDMLESVNTGNRLFAVRHHNARCDQCTFIDILRSSERPRPRVAVTKPI